MNKATRAKLEELAKSLRFSDNKSEVIRHMISEYYDNKG